MQCGFCTPGLVVATAALLERVPNPSDDVIREELSGNLCRCTGYAKIFDAVRLAAARMSDDRSSSRPSSGAPASATAAPGTTRRRR